jgi:hypothetical protein
MEMTAITAQVLSAIMIKMVVMIIKMNCNDDKINKLATRQFFIAKSTVLKLRGT